jgi:HEAT repeat protein
MPDVLTHPDTKVALWGAEAVRGLGRAAGAPAILQRLLDRLVDPYNTPSHLRETFGQAVASVSAAAVPAIVERLPDLLASQDARVRVAAAEAVGALGSTAAAPPIVERLVVLFADPESAVRGAAAWATVRLGVTVATPRILQHLLVLLNDPDRFVRRTASEAVHGLHQAGLRVLPDR